MKLKDLKKELLKDSNFKTAYYGVNTANGILHARLQAGLTQKELADKIGTKQTGIARWENGSSSPRVSSLEKIAKATGASLVNLIYPTCNFQKNSDCAFKYKPEWIETDENIITFNAKNKIKTSLNTLININ